MIAKNRGGEGGSPVALEMSPVHRVHWILTFLLWRPGLRRKKIMLQHTLIWQKILRTNREHGFKLIDVKNKIRNVLHGFKKKQRLSNLANKLKIKDNEI